MTVASAPAGSLRPRPAGRVLLPARLLRIELRRNAMPWLLPVIAVVFWLDSYRSTLGQPPLWSAQTAITVGQGHTLIDVGPFVAGAAAWMGSRDARRDTADLVSVTAWPRWGGQLATWLATTAWAVAAYLVCVCALYAVIAGRVSWGGPPWWPVVAGAAGVVFFSAVGFVAGALAPGRFAAPLTAFGAFVVLAASSHAGFSDRIGAWSVLPASGQGGLGFDSGVFYPYLPDLSIARLMALAGLSAAALGVLGLRVRPGTLRRARPAIALTVAGALVAGTGIGLLGTARVEAHGVVIPALHGAASDRPIAFVPVCSGGEPSVCVHPAYRPYLADVTAALDPVLRELRGLPGAPVHVTQMAASYLPREPARMSGTPPVLQLALGSLGLTLAGTASFADQVRLVSLHAFVGAGRGPGTPAQQAVQFALLRATGVPVAALSPGSVTLPLPSPGSPIAGAARRLASEPARMHRWLASHVAALRSGRIALDQLP